jgi:hypothetical protein
MGEAVGGLHIESCVDFWQVYPDTWQPSDPNNEDVSAPPGKVVPRGGIGKVWRQNFYNHSPITLDWPSAPERYTTATVQPFENATAFYLSEAGTIYVLFDRFHYITRSGDEIGRVWARVN